MKYDIVKHPDPILNEVMPDFDFSNPVVDPVELEANMLETQFSSGGLGLAAPQVGIRARVFTMGHIDHPMMGKAFFNPVVVEASSDFRDLEEGCLSFPGVYANIKRPTWIVAQWQDKEGNTENARFEGYDCKCYLHELDHLNGVNFKDRLSTLKWAMAIKKSNKERKKYVRTK
jgi:peptide deformylase